MPSSKKIQKDRIDKLLVAKNLVSTREKAQKLILAGLVKVEDIYITKPGSMVRQDAKIEIKGSDNPYVGRGGLKLQAALEHFQVSVEGKTAMDVGVSTGGFSDCLLQKGAVKIYAIDVGYGQLDWKLRNDPRIILFERTNIRNVSPDMIRDKIDLTVIDVSFISLTKVIPVVKNITDSSILALVKPQFEIGKGEVGKGGIVRNPAKQIACAIKIMEFCSSIGYSFQEPLLSPIPGAKGNREYFLYLSPERIADENQENRDIY